MNWIKISATEEISNEPLHVNKTFQEQKNSLEKGKRIADYPLLQKLRNEGKLPKEFWVRVFPNPDKISEEEGYVAWFVADSGWAVLSCNGVPAGRDAGLGVFVVRKISKGKKK